MVDVFISYAREDRDRVRAIAEAIEAGGYSIWWDQEIPPGSEMDDEIDKAINDASAIIVVWSESSIVSRWVKDEATDGVERGCLVALRIDDVAMPRGFKLVQTADLTGWSGEKEHVEWQKIQSRLIDLVGAAEGERGLISTKAQVAFNSADYNPEIPRIRGFASLFAGIKSVLASPATTLAITSAYLLPVLLPAVLLSYITMKLVSYTAGFFVFQAFGLLMLPLPFVLTAAHSIRRKWEAVNRARMPIWDLLGEVNFRVWRIYKVSFWVSILSFIGSLLVLPGIWILVRYGFAPSVAAAEGTNISQSLKKSRKISQRRFWSIFKFHLIAGGFLYLSYIGFYFVLVGGFNALGLDAGTVASYLGIAPNNYSVGDYHAELEVLHTALCWRKDTFDLSMRNRNLTLRVRKNLFAETFRYLQFLPIKGRSPDNRSFRQSSRA